MSIDESFETYTSTAICDVLKSEDVFNEKVHKKFIDYRNELRAMAHSSLKEFTINEFLIGGFKKILNLEIDYNKSLELERIYIHAELVNTSIFDDTLDFLERAASNGRIIYLTTNNFSNQHVNILIEKFGFRKYLKGVHISANCGIRKPSKGFLEYFFNTYGISKESAVIIGDKYNMDILCGKNFGIKTCLVDRKNQFDKFEFGSPDYVFVSLKDIEFSQI